MKEDRKGQDREDKQNRGKASLITLFLFKHDQKCGLLQQQCVR